MTINDHGFPDASDMTDPHVQIHLTSGRVIELQDVSVVEIAKRLHHWGFAFVSDGGGEYAIFFRNGVAALTARRDT